MITYLKSYATTHLFYIILIAIGAIALKEHDASIRALALADQQAKQSEAQVTSLKQEIATNDEKAAQQIAALEKTVQAVKTSQQAAQQIPVVAPNLPAPVAVQPDDSILFPKSDVLPLFQDLAKGNEAQVKLTQCQADYASEQKVEQQKDDEIKTYKKAAKKGFWGKFYTGLKIAGGVAVGYGIGKI